MLVGRDIEIRALAAAHANGIILASLTAPDFPEGIFFYPSFARMRGSVNWMVYYPIPFGWIVVIVEFCARDYVVGTVFVKRGAGTLDKNEAVVRLLFDEYLRVFKVPCIAVNT